MAADPTEIMRDCVDDGVLQGDYTTSELREARNELPTDADEYSDCRDVLSRAINGAGSSNDNGGGGGGGGGAGGGGTGGGTDPGTGASTGGGTPPSAEPDTSKLSDSAADAGKLPAPYTPEEHAAVNRAAAEGGRPVELSEHKIAPGTHLAAEVGRNDIPGTLIAVLALLGAATIALVGPAARRRVIARRQT
jgi:hypothetical protein